jgi:hypothetical protein
MLSNVINTLVFAGPWPPCGPRCRRLIEQLWERTCGVLVLLEPGTPSGAAHIQRARTQLLELGAKERVQQQQQQQLGGSSGSTGGAAAQAGAHVVAPCPHDGACPLEGRQSWCHFVQRFQRTALQRAAKASAGIQPRTYQDERFSYVAVARCSSLPKELFTVHLPRLPRPAALQLCSGVALCLVVAYCISPRRLHHVPCLSCLPAAGAPAQLHTTATASRWWRGASCQAWRTLRTFFTCPPT